MDIDFSIRTSKLSANGLWWYLLSQGRPSLQWRADWHPTAGRHNGLHIVTRKAHHALHHAPQMVIMNNPGVRSQHLNGKEWSLLETYSEIVLCLHRVYKMAQSLKWGYWGCIPICLSVSRSSVFFWQISLLSIFDSGPEGPYIHNGFHPSHLPLVCPISISKTTAITDCPPAEPPKHQGILQWKRLKANPDLTL